MYRDAARAVGRLFAARGITLVYGGGRVGMMGAVAEAVLAAGGKAIGVIPEGLKRKELAYESLTELIVTQTMHERKQRMADLADGFIALPGGFGTFEEFCEIVTWAQLGLHEKPCGLLNVKGYYDAAAGAVRSCAGRGFPASRSTAQLVITEDEPRAAARRRWRSYQAARLEKWLTPETA